MSTTKDFVILWEQCKYENDTLTIEYKFIDTADVNDTSLTSTGYVPDDGIEFVDWRRIVQVSTDPNQVNPEWSGVSFRVDKVINSNPSEQEYYPVQGINTGSPISAGAISVISDTGTIDVVGHDSDGWITTKPVQNNGSTQTLTFNNVSQYLDDDTTYAFLVDDGLFPGLIDVGDTEETNENDTKPTNNIYIWHTEAGSPKPDFEVLTGEQGCDYDDNGKLTLVYTLNASSDGLITQSTGWTGNSTSDYKRFIMVSETNNNQISFNVGGTDYYFVEDVNLDDTIPLSFYIKRSTNPNVWEEITNTDLFGYADSLKEDTRTTAFIITTPVHQAGDIHKIEFYPNLPQGTYAFLVDDGLTGILEGDTKEIIENYDPNTNNVWIWSNKPGSEPEPEPDDSWIEKNKETLFITGGIFIAGVVVWALLKRRRKRRGS
jgi:hypothetical protein